MLLKTAAADYCVVSWLTSRDYIDLPFGHNKCLIELLRYRPTYCCQFLSGLKRDRTPRPCQALPVPVGVPPQHLLPRGKRNNKQYLLKLTLDHPLAAIAPRLAAIPRRANVMKKTKKN